MANNKAIQFLRKEGTPTTEELNGLLSSQPFYDIANNKLYVGKNIINSLSKSDIRASFSWSTISELSKNGTLKDWFDIGDKFPFTIGTTIYHAILLDFDHDDKADGTGKAGSTWMMDELYSSSGVINYSDYSTGGWDRCYMRTSTMPYILSQMPADLQNTIVAVNKKTAVTTSRVGSTTPLVSIGTSTDKLWLISASEIWEADSPYVTRFFGPDEGDRYQYWINQGINNTPRVKKKPGAQSSISWWLRSPDRTNIHNFGIINQIGYSDGQPITYATELGYYTYASEGIACCFCL